MVRGVSRLMIASPGAVGVMLRIGYLLKRMGLSAATRPLLRAVRLPVLAAMDEHVEKAPVRLLDGELRSLRRAGEGDNWNYFAPCGPRYLYPRVGTATWKVLTKLKGPGKFLENPCCGLLANNCGDVESARTLARKNIENAEKKGEAPIVGDCSSCVAFLKTYPQLFLTPADAEWRARAERFSARVRDAIEIYGESAPSLPRSPEDGRVTYHDSCRARGGCTGLAVDLDRVAHARRETFGPDAPIGVRRRQEKLRVSLEKRDAGRTVAHDGRLRRRSPRSRCSCARARARPRSRRNCSRAGRESRGFFRYFPGPLSFVRTFHVAVPTRG